MELALNKLGEMILIALSMMAVAFVLFSVFLPGCTERGPEELCRSTVVTRVSTPLNLIEKGLYWAPLACETQDLDIKGNHEELKAQTAQLMARCWYMFNEGRQDELLNSDQVEKVFGWEDNDNECFLCYSLAIDQNSIEGGAIGADEMHKYLVEEDHYKVKGLTYLNYIQSYGGPGNVAIMDSIEPNNAYGVAFLGKSSDNSEWTWLDTVSVGAAAVACATGVGCIITAVVAGSYLTTHGVNEFASNFYSEERAVSTIVFDNLKSIKENSKCDIIYVG
jgi:hypothetical protein